MDRVSKEITDAEQIIIRTQNSEYRFSMTNPQERSGTLSGGSLGDHHRDAVLVGTLSSNNQMASDSSELKAGRRALFFLKAKHGVERLITSIITEIKRSTDIKRSHSISGERRAA
jgi:hypothetical protein